MTTKKTCINAILELLKVKISFVSRKAINPWEKLKREARKKIKWEMETSTILFK